MLSQTVRIFQILIFPGTRFSNIHPRDLIVYILIFLTDRFCINTNFDNPCTLHQKPGSCTKDLCAGRVCQVEDAVCHTAGCDGTCQPTWIDPHSPGPYSIPQTDCNVGKSNMALTVMWISLIWL